MSTGSGLLERKTERYKYPMDIRAQALFLVESVLSMA